MFSPNTNKIPNTHYSYCVLQFIWVYNLLRISSFSSMLLVNSLTKITLKISSLWSWHQPPRSSSAVLPMRMSQGRTLTSCCKKTTSCRTLREEPQCQISAPWRKFCWWGWSIVVEITETIPPRHCDDRQTPSLRLWEQTSNQFNLSSPFVCGLCGNRSFIY